MQKKAWGCISFNNIKNLGNLELLYPAMALPHQMQHLHCRASPLYICFIFCEHFSPFAYSRAPTGVFVHTGFSFFTGKQIIRVGEPEFEKTIVFNCYFRPNSKHVLICGHLRKFCKNIVLDFKENNR